MNRAREKSGGWGEMKARRFNGLMPVINEKWAARVLGIPYNESDGPDLLSDKCCIEIKFHLIGDEEDSMKYPRPAWTVSEHQMDWGNNGRQSYWGLGIYQIKTPVRKLRSGNKKYLEENVLSREIWVLPWNFMEKFPMSDTRGISKITGIAWHSKFRYPKKSYMEKIISRDYLVENGVVHFEENVDLRLFNLL